MDTDTGVRRGDIAARRRPGVSFAWAPSVPPRAVVSGVPLFVGFVHPRDGGAERPFVLDRWDGWAQAVPQGAFGYLDYAVRGFFENGGGRCWVWPLPVPVPMQTPAAAGVSTDPAQAPWTDRSQAQSRSSLQAPLQMPPQGSSPAPLRRPLRTPSPYALPAPLQIPSMAPLQDPLRAPLQTQLRAQLLALFSAGSPLEDLAEPDLVCVPDAGVGWLAGDSLAAPAVDDPAEALREVQRAVLAHCTRLRDRFALFDSAPLLRSGGSAATPSPPGTWSALAASVLTARHRGGTVPGAADGALYGPWIVVSALPRDAGRGPVRAVPPSGHVAGIYARLDAAPGRRKAPGHERVEGAHDVDACNGNGTGTGTGNGNGTGTGTGANAAAGAGAGAGVSAAAAADDDGINLLRVLPGRGVMVCGARTLSDLPAQRHVSVRRVVIGLVRWAESGLRDLVMEPHEPALWERIRQRVRSWCHARYLEGALRGEAPEQAYFVRCDAETNPPQERALGRVRCDVGLAITAPAEFIVVHLTPSAEGHPTVG